MKSLVSIIRKLSPNEILSFRSFLATHSRSGKNKKLELFDQLIRASDVTPFNPNATSRQSTYQLKKRLQDELYSFLIIQGQEKNGDDQLFLEMDCHRKLYCFKILYDKGIRDHASQVLNEILDISSEHGLHSIYLEAINLRNTYFPLRESIKLKIPIRYQLRKLKKALGRNLYINQYLVESSKAYYDNDGCFRLTLMNELVCFDLSATEPVVEELMAVNHLIHQRDFRAANEKLTQLSNADAKLAGDEKLRGLIYIDLSKINLCLGNIETARQWLGCARRVLGRPDSFSEVLLELDFILHARTWEIDGLGRTISCARQSREIWENDVLRGKWSCYSLYLLYVQNKNREVIKAINGDPIFAYKHKGWLINVKLLEMLCILRTGDFDWLFYKVESLRKIVSGLSEKPERTILLLSLIKTFVADNGSAAYLDDRIQLLEREHPWHPMSIEVINHAEALATISTSTSHHTTQPKQADVLSQVFEVAK